MTTKYRKLAHDEHELRRMTEIMDSLNSRLKEKVFTGADEVSVPTQELDWLLRQHAAMSQSIQEWLRLFVERQEEGQHWTNEKDPIKMGYSAACKAHLKGVRERLRNAGVLWMRSKR